MSQQDLAKILEEHFSVNPLDDHWLLDSPSGRNLMRDAADERITLLLHQISKLRTAWNSVAAISSLPNEVIGQVFLAYMQDRRPDWTKILRVCRSWHDIAIADPRLWTVIQSSWAFSNTEQRAIQWIKRSKQLPLTFHLCFQDNAACIVPLMQQNISRIRALQIDGSFADLAALFHDTTMSLPDLESLEIEWVPYKDARPWRLPGFLLGQVPKLHDLTLIGVGLSHRDDITSLSNLTQLTLESNNSLTLDVHPSINEVIEVLRRSPCLQNVRISDYIQQANNDSNVSIIPLSLDNLVLLDLEIESRPMLHVLQSVILPKSASIRLAPYDVHGAGERLTSLLVDIARRLQARVNRSMTVNSVSRHELSISVSPEILCPSSDSGFPFPHFSLVTFPASGRDLQRILRKIIHALPFDRESSLTLDGSLVDKKHGHLSAASWKALFTELSMPVNVQIGNNTSMVAMLKGLLYALAERCKPKGARYSRKHPYAPRILALEIDGTNDPGRGLFKSPNSSKQTKLFHRLIELLEQYKGMEVEGKRAGEPLEKLEIQFDNGYMYVFQHTSGLKEVVNGLSLRDSSGIETVISGKSEATDESPLGEAYSVDSHFGAVAAEEISDLFDH
ncbi:hypothetical protein C8J56DRAFT_1169628 [Mycena floridula]|nr:hypothetical protein C8J56DRAFT_1169628 [Mycena floridula]